MYREIKIMKQIKKSDYNIRITDCVNEAVLFHRQSRVVKKQLISVEWYVFLNIQLQHAINISYILYSFLRKREECTSKYDKIIIYANFKKNKSTLLQIIMETVY